MTLNSYKYKTMRYNKRKNASCVGIQSHGRVWLRVDWGWVTPQCIKLDNGNKLMDTLFRAINFIYCKES